MSDRRSALLRRVLKRTLAGIGVLIAAAAVIAPFISTRAPRHVPEPRTPEDPLAPFDDDTSPLGGFDVAASAGAMDDPSPAGAADHRPGPPVVDVSVYPPVVAEPSEQPVPTDLADPVVADETDADEAGADETDADETGTGETGTDEAGTDETGTDETDADEAVTHEAVTDEAGAEAVPTIAATHRPVADSDRPVVDSTNLLDLGPGASGHWQTATLPSAPQPSVDQVEARFGTAERRPANGRAAQHGPAGGKAAQRGPASGRAGQRGPAGARAAELRGALRRRRSLLIRLADLGIRKPKRVLGLAGLILVLAAVFGAPVASHLGAGGFTDPNAQSSRADRLLAQRFNAGAANVILELIAPDGVDSAAARRVGVQVANAVRDAANTSQVASYWTSPAQAAAALRSRDGKRGLVVARVAGDDSSAPKHTRQLVARLAGSRDGVTIRAGGPAVAYDEIGTQTADDLAAAEAVAIPLTVVALIWVFGSLLAALLPLVVGLTSIIGTLGILRGLASLTDVSIYALNMTTAMGLALAIDYSLLIVSRYREEVRAGRAPHDAVRRTMQTAGRTVLYSALTVGLSLSALLVFPVYFLRSFAYAGIAVVLFATAAALVLLPATLTLLGSRVDAWDLRALTRRVLRRPPPVDKPVEASFWYRLSSGVMRRAVPVGLLIVAVLVVLGLPFRNVAFGYPDERTLPPSAGAYQVGADLRRYFNANDTSNITVVVPDLGLNVAAVESYARVLSALPDVTSVTSSAGTFAGNVQVAPGNPAMLVNDATYLQVRNTADPLAASGKDLLYEVRAIPPPWPALYTGQTAGNQDSLDALGGALPYAITLIALATLIVLFLFTGSLLMPIKTLVLNTLSLTATFGAMVWIFQDGHLGWLFPDLTVTGFITPTMPLLMFCVAFGLSMDYEVFLLSRIREEWLASGRTTADNTRAVALGLGRTGRIVTAAALLMAIVFASIATSGVGFMMLFGTGLALAVVMDATVVRGMLVPALMRIAGRWNWWAPGPLARLHARIGLSDSDPADVDPPGQRKLRRPELVDA